MSDSVRSMIGDDIRTIDNAVTQEIVKDEEENINTGAETKGKEEEETSTEDEGVTKKLQTRKKKNLLIPCTRNIVKAKAKIKV